MFVRRYDLIRSASKFDAYALARLQLWEEAVKRRLLAFQGFAISAVHKARQKFPR